ncbi:hypothetical protein [Magnetospirillum molischianum]|uniref:Uncharacterized protein n=1 Tax=Magnetospirillum molischianum DSM 120 TaxID=1150626 RepID=H8FSK8_MAGML|nr:hypothetical protein [Magnetospirillum molischianum]CCG41346.1 conserved exported hypothetical protein [Magnetospirillum molischianum DSM 120]
MRNVAVLALAFSLLPFAAMAEDGGGPVLSQPLTVPAAAPPSEGNSTVIPPMVRPVSPQPAAVPSAPIPQPTPQSVKPLPAASSAPLESPPEPVVVAAADVASPLAAWVQALMLLVGAVIAGLIGMAVAVTLQGRDLSRRRRAIAATLAIELEARRQAFAAVPSPPNADAGVSFVSAVAALADFDCGWRSAQGSLYLLPDKLAGHLSVHYGAVHHVAAFVKGQSFAAALRMLQANRIGGHPCPDAGAMREAHVELAAAFRGVDKLLLGLKGLG